MLYFLVTRNKDSNKDVLMWLHKGLGNLSFLNDLNLGNSLIVEFNL